MVLNIALLDKNTYIKKNLLSNLEVVAEKVTNSLEKDVQEDFHEFLRARTDVLTKKVYLTKDYTYHNLKRIINDKTLAVVPGDKDACVVIMKRPDYLARMKR